MPCPALIAASRRPGRSTSRRPFVVCDKDGQALGYFYFWAHTEAWQANSPQTASGSRWRVSARIGRPHPTSRLSGES